MEDNIYRTTLNPREDRLLEEFKKYQYGVDIGEDYGRGGLHQIIDPEEMREIIDKRWKDGEIMLPKTSFEQLDNMTAEEYVKIQRTINETYGNPPIEVQQLSVNDEITFNNTIFKDGAWFPREISEIKTTVDSYKTRWNALKQKAIDYRNLPPYKVEILVTDLLKWMEELEGEDDI